MVKLPPPFWALAYTLIAIGASYLADGGDSQVCRSCGSASFSLS
jgi:hypothetical protein